MNLLIVDDEVLVMEGLLQSIEWKPIGVGQVFVAYNIHDAMGVLKDNNIDIVLCDIEMPMGDGMELLEWMRNNQYDIEFIFLTCHGEFKYAQKALQLGCVDYLLKPVEFPVLTTVIIKTIRKIEEKEKKEKYHEYGIKWETNKDKMNSIFWKEILLSSYSMDNDIIVDKGKKYNTTLNPNESYMVILFSVKYKPIITDQNERYIINFALDNLVEDIFLWDNIGYVKMSKDMVLIVFSENSQKDADVIKGSCYEYINCFYKFFGYKMAAYTSKFVELYQISSELHELIEMDQRNVSSDLFVYSNEQKRLLGSNYSAPNMVLWTNLLSGGKLPELKAEINKFYLLAVEKKWITRQNLINFMRDLDQMIFKVLEEKGFNYENYLDENSEELYRRRCESWEDMMEYIDMVLVHTRELNEKNKDASVIEKVKEYISINIDKEISREELANHVFLNPDYLSRIFKKEENITLKEYIINHKMEIAKELLVMTDMSISEIGMRVGYFNFAHFSTSFKKSTGLTPGIYRQKHSEN